MQPKRLPEPSVTVASALTVPLRKILYFDLISFTRWKKCNLEEGQEDVGNGLDGSNGQGVSTTIHSSSKRKGTGLALRDIGGAEEVRCGGEKLVTVVVAEEEWVIKHES